MAYKKKIQQGGNTTWICKPNRAGTAGGCGFQGITITNLPPSSQGCSASPNGHNWVTPAPGPAYEFGDSYCEVCNFYGSPGPSPKSIPQAGCPGLITNPGLTEHDWTT